MLISQSYFPTEPSKRKTIEMNKMEKLKKSHPKIYTEIKVLPFDGSVGASPSQSRFCSSFRSRRFPAAFSGTGTGTGKRKNA